MAASSKEWTDKAGKHLKAELKRVGVPYAELARRLTKMGIPETDTSVAAKVNRGRVFRLGSCLPSCRPSA